MMKRNFWLKLIAVLIIQALFLTQVDFSLAAVYQSKEVLQEGVLKLVRIKDADTSLISGISCVYFAVFSILRGSGTSITELVYGGEVRTDTKHIYKAFIHQEDKIIADNTGFSIIEIINNGKQLEQASTQNSRAPPAEEKIALMFTQTRTT
ncbi:MAG: hypothetical protein GY853_03665 [PVC group bacterium]|nr:hypothetical protein [PVC group bacterium]